MEKSLDSDTLARADITKLSNESTHRTRQVAFEFKLDALSDREVDEAFAYAPTSPVDYASS